MHGPPPRWDATSSFMHHLTSLGVFLYKIIQRSSKHSKKAVTSGDNKATPMHCHQERSQTSPFHLPLQSKEFSSKRMIFQINTLICILNNSLLPNRKLLKKRTETRTWLPLCCGQVLHLTTTHLYHGTDGVGEHHHPTTYVGRSWHWYFERSHPLHASFPLQFPLQTLSGNPSRFQSPSFVSLLVPQRQVATHLPKSKRVQPPPQRDSQWAVCCLVGIKGADRSFKQKKLTYVGKCLCFPRHNCKITVVEKVKKTSLQCVFCAWQFFADKYSIFIQCWKDDTKSKERKRGQRNLKYKKTLSNK